MNNFQQSLTSNIECIWEIVKVFHPDIKDVYDYKPIKTKDRLKITTKYDWVCIHVNVPFISVALGVEFECHLYSGSKPMSAFVQEIKNNKFRCWRFVDDSKYQSEKDIYELTELRNKQLNDILKKHGIKKPTAKQMSDYYHSD